MICVKFAEETFNNMCFYECQHLKLPMQKTVCCKSFFIGGDHVQQCSIELFHEIMVLFVLRKFILQTRMRSHPMGLDVWFLVGHFVYFHTLCVRTAKALARLRGRAGSLKPSLVAYVIIISTIISPWAASIVCTVLSGKCQSLTCYM